MKRWAIVPMKFLEGFEGEWHAVHIDDITAFVGINRLTPKGIDALTATVGVVVLPPINSSAVVGEEIANKLSIFGVGLGDTTYGALEKIIGVSGMHQVGLEET